MAQPPTTEKAIRTVVITGASSGIGQAVALALAQRKYNLVLASRNAGALQKVAARCEQHGATTRVVVADVSKPDDVENLAQKAVEHFGSIDVWMNNASTIFYSRFLDMQPEEFRQVIETNVFGVVYGSRVALQQFKAQSYGTLVNIASGLGAVPAPYVSAYITSKFAVRGLTASLMQEFYVDGEKGINICCVLPATIDTPIYQHSGNRMGRTARALPPVYSIDKAVRTIVRVVDRPKPETVIGAPIRFATIMYALFPAFLLKRFARYVHHFTYRGEPSHDHSGNTFEPGADGNVSGGWDNKPKELK